MRRIFARETDVREVSQNEAVAFALSHHRQGFPKKVANTFSYGLFYENELVGLVVFSNPRTSAVSRTYCHELIRMVFPENVRVVGGASKLIRAFIDDRNPFNFFTYQDMNGEATDVYEKCGMKLVSSQKNKRVFVRNGITFAQAKNNRRDWFSTEQVVRFGPDNLLKASFGEQFNDDGSRMSNVDIFTKLAGYHVETLNGDRVYEWHNPCVWFYTYRINATDSDKYYIGRRAYRADSEPSVEDCVNDGYFGSGGVKYQNWLSRHEKTLVKHVDNIFDTWGEAVKAETKLIGTRYKDDPCCLNSMPGGVSLGATGGVQHKDMCPKHGEATFRGNRCLSCANTRALVRQVCPVHGDAYFEDGKCVNCEYRVAGCSTHGDNSPHKGGTCVQCFKETVRSAKKERVKQKCPIHGEQFFNGDSCSVCLAKGRFYLSTCFIHGETKHLKSNGRCVSCVNSDSIDFRRCDEHGENTPFVLGRCFLCESSRENKTGFFTFVDYQGGLQKDVVSFVCPLCHAEKDMKRKNFNVFVSSGRVACFSCRKSMELWNSPVGEVISRYVQKVDFSIVNHHSNKQVDIHCPHCGEVSSRTFCTLYRRVRGKGYLCDKCRTEDVVHITRE